MDYIVEDTKYSLSYQELKEHYLRFKNMSDEEFVKDLNLKEALHLACVICYLKETPAEWIVSDHGIIHELVHLLHIGKEPVLDLDRIRGDFNRTLELS